MSRRPACRLPRRPNSAFTLIELMVVIGIITAMTLLLVPAFKSMKGAGDVTSAAYTIKGALEQARAYAMANHTYTWVGFYEEAATNSTSGTSHPAGVGRVVISMVASKDGTRYRDAAIDASNPPAFDNSVSPRPFNNRVILVQLGNLIRIENAHLPTDQTAGPTRPTVVTSYRVGHNDFAIHPSAAPPYNPVTNPTTFTYPLSGTTQYVFQKAIEFAPSGSANKICDKLTQLLEIAVQPTHSTTVDSANANVFAIHIQGVSGNMQLYRP